MPMVLTSDLEMLVVAGLGLRGFRVLGLVVPKASRRLMARNPFEQKTKKLHNHHSSCVSGPSGVCKDYILGFSDWYRGYV